jgi:hypothetical protein
MSHEAVSSSPLRRAPFGRNSRHGLSAPTTRSAINPLIDAPSGLSVVTDRTQLMLSDDLDITAWGHLGRKIAVIGDSSAWWLADWLIFGQDKYPDHYRRAIKDTGLDYQTLRNYAWVARRFAPSRRRPNLSFQHHMEVAPFPPEEQDHWLDFAEKLAWSKNELRQQCRAASSKSRKPHEKSPNTGPSSLIHVEFKVPASNFEQWEIAAQRSNTDLVAWMAGVLDRAATSTQGATPGRAIHGGPPVRIATEHTS